jgi:hypothetical protein
MLSRAWTEADCLSMSRFLTGDTIKVSASESFSASKAWLFPDSGESLCGLRGAADGEGANVASRGIGEVALGGARGGAFWTSALLLSGRVLWLMPRIWPCNVMVTRRPAPQGEVSSGQVVKGAGRGCKWIGRSKCQFPLARAAPGKAVRCL